MAVRAARVAALPPGIRPGPLLPWASDRIARRLRSGRREADPGAAAAGSRRPGRILGLCTAYQDLHSVRFGYRAWVEDLAVDPERRSQGVGKALLDAAKAWARERGATHLELDSAEARADAHRFYEREGAQYRAISFGWEL